MANAIVTQGCVEVLAQVLPRSRRHFELERIKTLTEHRKIDSAAAPLVCVPYLASAFFISLKDSTMTIPSRRRMAAYGPFSEASGRRQFNQSIHWPSLRRSTFT